MVYMYHSFLIHSSADGHLGCFHVLAMTNSAAMNIGVHVSLSDLISSVCMPRSGLARSHNKGSQGRWLIFKTIGDIQLIFWYLYMSSPFYLTEKKKKKNFLYPLDHICPIPKDAHSVA